MAFLMGSHTLLIRYQQMSRLELLKFKKKKHLDHVNEVKDSFIERVKDLEKYSFVGDARALGLIGAIDL